MSSTLFYKKLTSSLKKINSDPTLQEAILTFFKNAHLQELYRINVALLVHSYNLKLSDTLNIFYQLMKEGILDLNWDYHCPHCNGIASRHNHLKDSTTEDYCGMCELSFKNEIDSNVEITFTPSMNFELFDEKFKKSYIKSAVKQIKEKTLSLPDKYVSGLDIMHIPVFREYFQKEIFSTDQTMSIKHISILFTDIKGSTELYEKLGDTAAFSLVQRHFDILIQIIEKNSGVVVKTIGDAVMASFINPASAGLAAIEIQRELERMEYLIPFGGKIAVKIGLHFGPAIVVNLNNRIDYFGQTVNLTARIQSAANVGEILISEEMRNNEDFRVSLKSEVVGVRKKELDLKGIEGKVTVFVLEKK